MDRGILGQFMQLFAGRDDAIGFGEGRIERREPTADDFRAHLAGEGNGIGIFPLRDDGMVMFAAIDLDEPDFDLAADFQLFLPGETWIERSRSGNAHVWAFFREPCPGWIARGLMKHATESLDKPSVEIFPKQPRLLEGMVGNYINLPYHGTGRPILWDRDNPFSIAEFVDRAYGSRLDPDAWARRAEALKISPPSEADSDADFGEQPFLHDCAAHILKHREDNPLVPGHRSAVLFHVAVQLLNWRDLSLDEASALVHELNDAGTHPADRREVDRIIRNAASGRYTFTGCDDPLMAPYVKPDCPFAGN